MRYFFLSYLEALRPVLWQQKNPPTVLRWLLWESCPPGFLLDEGYRQLVLYHLENKAEVLAD